MPSLLSQRMIDRLPEIVKRTVGSMNDEDRLHFERHYLKRRMVTWPLVLLAVFFPIQLFVLGKIGLGIVFWLTAGGFFIWWFIEIFLTPTRVQQYNEDLSIEIIRDIKALESV